MSDIVFAGGVEPSLFDGDQWGTEAYSLPGLVECEKSWLEGVPHVITRVTFWVSDIKDKDFVSLQAVVAPDRFIRRQLDRNKIRELDDNGRPKVDPEEAIVYSDGSTGIRRQIVSLLETFKLIEIKSDLPPNGKLGESRYDLNFTHWEFEQATEQGDTIVPDFTKMHNGSPLRINVKGGLMSSKGDNHTEEGKPTYYLR